MTLFFLIIPTFLFSQTEPNLVNAKSKNDAIFGQDYILWRIL